MNLKKQLCRLLIALMAWAPFQFAQAGMIGTDKVATSQAGSDRAAVLSFLGRAEVAKQLQALGIDPAQAKSRVQSMNDQEVAALAGQMNALPAGAMSDGWAVVLILAVIAGVWWWMKGGRLS